MPNKPVALLAGGGTAGHVNPMLATAAHLKSDFEVVCVGTAEGLEADLVPAAGYELVTVPKLAMPRRPSPDLVRLPINLHREVARMQRLIEDREATVVVGFGAYVSTPLYLAARRTQTPLVIHEQNARPGLANRLGARWANVVATTFPSTPLRARVGHTATIGLPLRPPIAELVVSDRRARRQSAANRFGLAPERPVLLVTGGSLGALSINRATAEAAGTIDPDIQILHITGKNKAETVLKERARSESYVVSEYVTDMEEALAVADLVVCRSGAGTVAELSALGIPAIYVPLPIGNGEQRLNAADVVEAGGALIITDSECTAQKLTTLVNRLCADPDALAAMSTSAREFGRVDAAEYLADFVRGSAS